jgi:hypothetical protein
VINHDIDQSFSMTGRTRYVLRGVPGGWRIWDNKAKRFWGDLYEVCPDELTAELNGSKHQSTVVHLTRKARGAKR